MFSAAGQICVHQRAAAVVSGPEAATLRSKPHSTAPICAICGHALARIRTGTALATAPSRQRVYQFHHQGGNGANLLRRKNLLGSDRGVKPNTGI